MIFFCKVNFWFTLNNFPGVIVPNNLLIPVTVAPDKVKNLLLKADLRWFLFSKDAQKLDMRIIDLLEILSAKLQLILAKNTDIFGQAVVFRDLKYRDIIRPTQV